MDAKRLQRQSCRSEVVTLIVMSEVLFNVISERATTAAYRTRPADRSNDTAGSPAWQKDGADAPSSVQSVTCTMPALALLAVPSFPSPFGTPLPP
jgi:hypothetical protein